MKHPTRRRLREALKYNSRTGIFRWRIAPNGRIKIGQIAGCVDAYGYIIISLDCVDYRAHHLAWFYVKARWPKGLDHWNLKRADNRIRNLRRASRSQNNANKRCYRNNLSGIKGLYLRKGRWRVQIRRNGTTEHVGYFSTKAKAARIYRLEARKVFGEFACFRGKAAA